MQKRNEDVRMLYTGMLLCFNIFCLQAQNIELEEAVKAFAGVSEAESLDPDMVEQLEEFLRTPLKINRVSGYAIESSGLFTSYQSASLDDYIDRHGAVCSLVELSAIDGFSSDFVEVLAPFVSLETPGTPASRSRQMCSWDVSVRGGFKKYLDTDDDRWIYGIRSRASFSDKFIASLSASHPYDASSLYPSNITGNFQWLHSCGKLIIGDFNARFGQGLALWNTATFSSLSSPSSFMRRPSGLSGSNSFTGTNALTGIAADVGLGRWQISLLLAAPGIKRVAHTGLSFLPGVNISRYGRIGHIALMHVMEFSDVLSKSFRIPMMSSSIDGACCFRGVNVFGEVVYDWVGKRVSALSGVQFSSLEMMDWAAMVRYRPALDEIGASAAGEISWQSHKVRLSLDGAYYPAGKSKGQTDSYQFKGQFDWEWNLTPALILKMRLSERFRNWGLPSRAELRTDLSYSLGNIRFCGRADFLYGRDFSILWYLESGYADRRLAAYIRYGMFRIDSWDDRIYVYERDAPGYFSVPAYYGRGLWTSVYIKWHFAKWGKLYLRGVYKKPGNAELKLQMELDF